MTPRTTAQPQMSVEEFEELARRAAEFVRLEFISGKVQVKPVPDGNHAEIVKWLQRQCMQHRPELWLYPEQGLKVEAYRKGRARPDSALAPDDYFAGAGEWADPTGVLMAVEVTSHDSDTNRRDRVEKPDGYAAAGIPVYLLIDREACSVTVCTEPEKGTYRSSTTRPFGAVVELPEPVGFTLETEKLKDYAD
ncbi:Uma2 family endonuclease [Streptomyces sp. NBC_00654]|uniref:Uma2 family endonuclease n=1 Tax=Streptomyces sp. NBC_00654 TaxID=2975799 RepID=UPI00224EA761|nr:Uma2 family endonuclease [Streptomyces sp. NBC_00654]MCX4963722.1 Uma2 family endonuclease [Streptomyces sp. NBC_00654]